MKTKKALLTVFKVILILAVFIGIIIVTKTRQTNRVFVNNYATSDVVYADGRTAHFNSKNFGMVNKGDVVTVHLALPKQPIFENAVLTFYIYHSVTEIWCNGQLIDGYGAEIDARGDMVGNARFLTTVPDAAWGGEITIVLRVTENNAFSRIRNLGVYDAKDAYQYYLDVDPVSFWVLLPLFMISVIGLFLLLVTGAPNQIRRKGIYIALFAALASLYFLTSKGVNHMFGLHQYLWTQLEFVAVYTMALPILLWAFETEKKGTWMKKALMGALIVNGAFFAAATVLHLTNVAHYCALLLASNVLTFLSGALLLVFAVKRRIRGTGSDKLFFSGMLIMFGAGLFDLLRTNLYKFFPAVLQAISLPSVLPIGILFLVVYMLRAYLTEITERQKKLITAQVEAGNLGRVLDTTPTGICQVIPNESLTIVAANDIFYGIIGYRDAEVIQSKPKEFFTYLYDNEKAFIHSKVNEILHSKETTGQFEFSTVDVEDNPLTIMVRYFYDREGSGNITVNVIDITDRKRVEDELRISEERYRLALEQSGKVFFFFDVKKRTMRLSDELAQGFGLPNVVDDMPENFIAKGLVEPESVEAYRDFYRRIIAGEKHGETIISCHMRQHPEQKLWYRISFTSIFDEHGKPATAAIIYEDLTERRLSEIKTQWKQLNLLALPEASYFILEFDLTEGVMVNQSGELFARIPNGLKEYEEVNGYMLNRYVSGEDIAPLREFLDRTRLLETFSRGTAEDTMECRTLQNDTQYRWTNLLLQMAKDAYSGHVVGQFIARDIHAEKSGQIEMRRNMEELEKELENSRIKVMINQMQPHFLYNALSAIQTIVKTDPDYAYQLIYDFTIHLRSSIKALQSDEPILFADELKNIRAYLNIEQMRFGDCFKVRYEIDCDSFKVIPLSIQPLAENAARHGLYPKGEEGGEIVLRSYETNESYIVEVEDDGLGFNADEVLNRQTDSVGLKNLIFRLKSLMNADVAIYSRLGVGTKVRVTIPKKEYGVPNG